jgi:hypothetical protein
LRPSDSYLWTRLEPDGAPASLRPDPTQEHVSDGCGRDRRVRLQLFRHGQYGLAPLTAAWLFGTFKSATAIAVHIAICAVISVVATVMMTDYTGKDISGEYQAR